MKLALILMVAIFPYLYGVTSPKTPESAHSSRVAPFKGGATAPRQDELAKSVERGKDVYNAQCISCHQPNGEGLSGVYPPLAGSDHLTKDQDKSISIILKGQNEEITVKGTKYSVPMAALNSLTDQQVADVLNYMGNSWGNKFNTVTPAQVKAKRE